MTAKQAAIQVQRVTGVLGLLHGARHFQQEGDVVFRSVSLGNQEFTPRLIEHALRDQVMDQLKSATSRRRMYPSPSQFP